MLIPTILRHTCKDIFIAYVSTALSSSLFNFYSVPYGCLPNNVQTKLYECCEQRDIDFDLMLALIDLESRYNEKDMGDNGDSYGYMQIQPKWWQHLMDKYGVTNLLDGEQNVIIGVAIYDYYYDLYGDTHKALMCYNMGENGAKEAWARGEYTSAYSRYIVSRAKQIKEENNEQK